VSAPVPVRRISFSYPDDLDPDWNRRLPQFAAAANSVALLMPYAEPYFVRSIRAVLPRLPEPLRTEAHAYMRQETEHHRQHRRFNDLVVARHPRLARLEALAKRAYGGLARRRSERFNLAFAAGSETMAFCLARWSERHLSELFDDADPVPATLFLWHLAEEAEHKAVAHDVWVEVDGSRPRYACATALSLLLLTTFTVAGTLAILWDQHRLRSPLTWVRLVRWAVSFGFVLFPTLAVSCLPGHHPRDLTDPVFLPAWLRQYDHETRTMPLYDRRAA
jgi:predicted metal-dependent hydrolase